MYMDALALLAALVASDDQSLITLYIEYKFYMHLGFLGNIELSTLYFFTNHVCTCTCTCTCIVH